LGGNRHGLRKQIINTCIIFIVSGIWHGANFTFILWGVAHAIFFIPGILFRKKIYAIPAYANSILIIGKILYTNCIVILLWFLFRAQSIEDVVIIFSKIFSADIFELNTTFPFHIFVLVCILMITEWFGRRNDYAIVGIAGNAPRMVRWSIYYGIMITILYYFETPLNYIYFQF
jgi:D-alanyl-lipoteichoic acid acyltransferase DltB (MBOAT superfamily)